MVPGDSKKPLSLAVEEINQSKVKILQDDEVEEDTILAESESEEAEADIEVADEVLGTPDEAEVPDAE